MVESDADLSSAVPSGLLEDDSFSVAFLANKLLLLAARGGAVPIVGRDYATHVLVGKAARWTRALRHTPSAPLATPQQALSVQAFGAGLAFRFLPDEQLERLPWDRLPAFKEKHAELLARHQGHLLEVAQAFRGLPEGDNFEERLAALRREAVVARGTLDEAARDAWLSVGVEVAKKAAVAASGGLVSALAMIRGHSLHELLLAGFSATAAAAGVTAAAAMDEWAKKHRLHRSDFAYLFEAQSLVSKT